MTSVFDVCARESALADSRAAESAGRADRAGARPVGVGVIPRARPSGRARGSLPLSPDLLVITRTGDSIPRSRYPSRSSDDPSFWDARSVPHGTQASPPVSQPIRTCGEMSARDPLELVRSGSSPSTQSSPTAAPWYDDRVPLASRSRPARPATGPSTKRSVLDEGDPGPGDLRLAATQPSRRPRAGRRPRPRRPLEDLLDHAVEHARSLPRGRLLRIA